MHWASLHKWNEEWDACIFVIKRQIDICKKRFFVRLSARIRHQKINEKIQQQFTAIQALGNASIRIILHKKTRLCRCSR